MIGQEKSKIGMTDNGVGVSEQNMTGWNMRSYDWGE